MGKIEANGGLLVNKSEWRSSIIEKSRDSGIGKFSFIQMFSKLNFEMNFKHITWSMIVDSNIRNLKKLT